MQLNNQKKTNLLQKKKKKKGQETWIDISLKKTPIWPEGAW